MLLYLLIFIILLYLSIFTMFSYLSIFTKLLYLPVITTFCCICLSLESYFNICQSIQCCCLSDFTKWLLLPWFHEWNLSLLVFDMSTSATISDSSSLFTLPVPASPVVCQHTSTWTYGPGIRGGRLDRVPGLGTGQLRHGTEHLCRWGTALSGPTAQIQVDQTCSQRARDGDACRPHR